MLLPNIASLQNYGHAFSFLSSLVPVSLFMQTKIATALSFLIGFSAMGAAYGLLFSNAWNLYALAEHDHTIASKQLTMLNQHGMPLYAVLCEGLICFVFLVVTAGAKIPLQQTAALGCTLTYTISSIAFLMLSRGSRLIGILSLLTCLGFIVSCVKSAASHNFTSLYLFACMFAVGMAMYFRCLKK
jgi:hypothetical protein